MIQLTPAAAAALAKLRAMPATFQRDITGAFDRACNAALGRTQRERFTGQGPFPAAQRKLGVVTGRLRNSMLLASREKGASLAGTALVRTITVPVVYFARHEFGFTGTENVRAHTRDVFFSDRGKRIGALAAKRRQARGKAVSRQSVAVRAHTRKVNTPARAPLRTGLSEHLGAMLASELLRVAR